jgi:hypothetical protein
MEKKKILQVRLLMKEAGWSSPTVENRILSRWILISL